MNKLIFLFCGVFLLACNNQSSDTAGTKDTATNTTTNTANVALNEDAMSFLSGCVESAKALHGEQGAYTLCKCVYTQIQQKYPSADSATLLKHLSDTAEVAQMAQNCQ